MNSLINHNVQWFGHGQPVSNDDSLPFPFQSLTNDKNNVKATYNGLK